MKQPAEAKLHIHVRMSMHTDTRTRICKLHGFQTYSVVLLGCAVAERTLMLVKHMEKFEFEPTALSKGASGNAPERRPRHLLDGETL